MTLSRKKQSFFMNFFRFSISVVIALIAIQMIIAVFVAILTLPFASNLPNIISAVIFLIGIGLALFLGILCFRKVHRSLKEWNRGAS